MLTRGHSQDSRVVPGAGTGATSRSPVASIRAGRSTFRRHHRAPQGSGLEADSSGRASGADHRDWTVEHRRRAPTRRAGNRLMARRGQGGDAARGRAAECHVRASQSSLRRRVETDAARVSDRVGDCDDALVGSGDHESERHVCTELVVRRAKPRWGSELVPLGQILARRSAEYVRKAHRRESRAASK